MQITTKPARVLIFDSGVGALSVFKEITDRNPSVHCTLALDNALFPYGEQPQEDLITRVLNCINHLITECRPDIIVIACNTASTLVLAHLRQRFTVPFVGVVPAIKPAAIQSRTKIIGLLATPATVARDYTNQLIDDFALNCEVLKVGSTELVTMAERKLRGENIDSEEQLEKLKRILQPFLNRITSEKQNSDSLDTLVLACTHFPLLEGEIRRVLSEQTPGHSIKIVDSGSAIAERVYSLLDSGSWKTDNGEQKELHQVILTAMDEQMSHLNAALRSLGCAPAKVIPL